MNKKIAFQAAATLLVIAAAILFYFYPQYTKNSQPQNRINEMSGSIIGLKNGLILVQGSVGKEVKTIEFAITSETILRNMVISLTSGQIASGKPFHPDTQIKTGSAQDLIAGVKVIKIQSKENLSGATGATAINLEYLTYVYPDQ